MRVLLTGGGTAGHINPAIAIAQTIREHDPEAVFLFVGTPRGLENRLVPPTGIPMKHVRVRGFSRNLNPLNLLSAVLAVTSPLHAKKILRDFKPDIVIGTGGYVSWPPIRAAHELGIPTVLHESNATPGLTVRKLASQSDKVLVNFEGAKRYLPDAKTVVTVGNPMKAGFRTISREESRKTLGIEGKKLILSFGGSLGAEKVNDACLNLMKEYTANNPDVIHVHGCGERNLDDFMRHFRAAFPTPPENVRVFPYIHNMPLYMGSADVVIARAGAMTLSELALSGKASVLIPSPNVTDNHQYKNAHLLEEGGAAVLIEESDTLAEELTSAVTRLVHDDDARHAMESKIQKYAVRDANDRIYAEIRSLIEEKK